MKRTHLILTGVAAALTLGLAVAQGFPGGGMGPGYGPGASSGMGPGMGPRGGMMGPRGMAGRTGWGDPAALADARLADLKAELKITSAQEGAWQAFAAMAKQQAETMQALRGKMLQATGPAPERMSQHTELMKQRISNMEAMNAALAQLYAVLTPEQKAIADLRFAPMGGRGMAFNR